MSQTKFLSVIQKGVTRTKPDGTSGQGDAGSTHLYVGMGPGNTWLYSSLLEFGLDWTNVGRIIKATLVLYTDDHNGLFPVPSATDTPRIVARRLTGQFLFGNNADEVWDATDYSKPAATTSGQVTPLMAKAAGAVNRIDITAIFNEWAPSTVARSDGKPGTGQGNKGIILAPFNTNASARWAGWSSLAADPGVRPQIELEYDYGLTKPAVPTNLAPTGSVSVQPNFAGDFTDTNTGDKLAATEVEVYPSSATVAGQVVTGARLWYRKQAASESERQAARFGVIPDTLSLAPGAYKWRARVTDNQGQVSDWTTLISYTTTNTPPVAPTLTPDGQSYASLNAVQFRSGAFSDPDAGSKLNGYQVQLALLAPGSGSWDDPTFLSWDTGRVYTATGATSFAATYGGGPLPAGAYHWRARVWDQKNTPSDWTYAAITLTDDFVPQPGQQAALQANPQAPWRIVIRGMGASRGPGTIKAILENAKSVGASIMYNSPGELHFTLPVDHPQISVIEPKQTHYAVELYSGDGWREVFAGLVDDMDANERDVIFYGVDYLALYDRVLDERYDPANPDKPYTAGGSKYVDKTINQVVTDQLTRAKGLANSPVGFINIGPIATMDERVTIWSTMQHTLQFAAGLIDSHRQGTGKKTRIKVEKTTGGAYQVTVEDDPGVQRDALRLKYGELVQGYRVIPFGPTWSSLMHAIGRTREGIKVMYKTASAPGIDQAIWGRHAQAQLFDGVSDENDLIRRTQQAALTAGKLGRRVALGIRSGIIQPLDGYDVCDAIPVSIDHGAVRTANYGSGYWVAFGVAWETGDEGAQNTTLTLLPREDSTPPNPDLIPTRPISPQLEWQVGWDAPDPLQATSQYWLDQNTGRVYQRNDSGTYDLIVGGAMIGPVPPSTPGIPGVTSVISRGTVTLKVTI